MPASLRDLTRKPVSRKVVIKLIERVVKDGDVRTGVLITTALIDKGLERLIKTRMHRLNSQDREAMFGPTGHLGTLPAKIRMAFALGIIGPRTRADLLAINDIRNVCAHSVHFWPFSRGSLQQKLDTVGPLFTVLLEKELREMIFHGTDISEHFDKMNEESRYKGSAPRALVLTIAIYAVFIASDPHKKLPPKRGKTSFYGYKFSPLSN